MLEIYVDGACRGNQKTENLGAWAFTVAWNGIMIAADSQAVPNTTNNIMELAAVIEVLKRLNNGAKQEVINIYCDSQYVVSGVNEWSRGWIARGWAGVKNAGLWQQLLGLLDKFPTAKLIKVAGHSDNPGNEQVDTLCNKAMDEYLASE